MTETDFTRQLTSYTLIWVDWTSLFFGCTQKQVKRCLSDHFGTMTNTDTAVGLDRLGFLFTCIGNKTLHGRNSSDNNSLNFTRTVSPTDHKQVMDEVTGLTKDLTTYLVDDLGQSRMRLNTTLKQLHGPLTSLSPDGYFLRVGTQLHMAADIIRGGDLPTTKKSSSAKNNPEWKDLHSQYTGAVRLLAQQYRTSTRAINTAMVKKTGKSVNDETVEGLHARLDILSSLTPADLTTKTKETK